MSTKTYSNYRPRTNRYLPNVPAHWESTRFKLVLEEREERSTKGSELLLSVSEYTGVSPRSAVIDKGDHLSRAESLVGYKVCYPSDLVMNIMLAWKKAQGVSNYHGIVSPAYSVYALSTKTNPRFIHYLVRTQIYADYFKSFSSGVIDSRLRLYPDTFMALKVDLPPVDEQSTISVFLDRETAKIDALIAEQERLIELLQEKRQAVISHAVTKGLNPDAPMKDSGVEWLGAVPEHWEVGQLRRYVEKGRKITYGIVQPGEPDPTGKFMIRGQDYSSGWSQPDSIFRVSAAIEEPYARSRLKEGDLVMTIVGAGLGNTEEVPEWLEGANLTQTTCRIAVDTELMRPRYMKFILDSFIGRYSVGLYAKGAAQPGLNLEHVKMFPITCPPFSEQILIIEHLSEITSNIDQLINQSHSASSLLQERRSALISAAVTGQIDVRELAQKETA